MANGMCQHTDHGNKNKPMVDWYIYERKNRSIAVWSLAAHIRIKVKIESSVSLDLTGNNQTKDNAH